MDYEEKWENYQKAITMQVKANKMVQKARHELLMAKRDMRAKEYEVLASIN